MCGRHSITGEHALSLGTGLEPAGLWEGQFAPQPWEESNAEREGVGRTH